MEKSLILLRGIPGSGKSTLSKIIGGVHFEADMYFVRDGVYQFDANKIKDAHNWCAIQCQKAMCDNFPKIVISNTFTQEWEMEVYYNLAKENGYKIFSLIVENRHGGENIHNVPSQSIQKMIKRFEVKLK